jgi:Fe-S cluster assembly scaffold protein SufB
MASGKLGAAAIPAAAYTTVYTVPASTVSSINVALVNRGSDPASVRVAITTETVAPLDADFIEFDAVIPENGGILERTALVAGAGERVMIYTDVATLSARVHGFEEAE